MIFEVKRLNATSMNKIYLGFWLAIVPLLFASCGKQESETAALKAKLKARYFTEADSVYITGVSDMQFIGDKLIMTEFERSRFLVLDDQFALDTIIGRYGKGPDEYFYIGAIGAINDGFFVHDVFNGRLRVFDESLGFVGNLKLHYPEEVSNFAFRDSVLSYVSLDAQGYPIVTIDLKSDSIRRYGKFLEAGRDVFQKVNRSRGYLFPVDERTVFFHSTEPLVKVYNPDFEVVFELNFADLDLLKNSLKRAELTYKNKKNTYILLFEDVFQYSERFYLTAYTDYKTNEAEKNYGFGRRLHSIIEMEYDPQKPSIELKSIIDLSDGGGWYEQIIVESDRILAFDAINDELHEFELD